MTDIILYGIFTGCFAAWFLTLAAKRGWLNTWQSDARNDLLWQLLSCKYCLSWWTSLVASAVCAVVVGNGWLLLSAFVGTMVSKHLIDR